MKRIPLAREVATLRCFSPMSLCVCWACLKVKGSTAAYGISSWPVQARAIHIDTSVAEMTEILLWPGFSDPRVVCIQAKSRTRAQAPYRSVCNPNIVVESVGNVRGGSDSLRACSGQHNNSSINFTSSVCMMFVFIMDAEFSGKHDFETDLPLSAWSAWLSMCPVLPKLDSALPLAGCTCTIHVTV